MKNNSFARPLINELNIVKYVLKIKKQYFNVLHSLNVLYLPLKYSCNVSIIIIKKEYAQQLQIKMITFGMNYPKLLFSFDNGRKSSRVPAEHPLIMS